MSSVVAAALSIQSLGRDLTELQVLGDPADALWSFIHLLCDQLGYQTPHQASLKSERSPWLSSNHHRIGRREALSRDHGAPRRRYPCSFPNFQGLRHLLEVGVGFAIPRGSLRRAHGKAIQSPHRNRPLERTRGHDPESQRQNRGIGGAGRDHDRNHRGCRTSLLSSGAEQSSCRAPTYIGHEMETL